MKKKNMEWIMIAGYMLKWLILALIIGGCMGSLSAFFLTSLEWVTNYRFIHPWIILFLPASGSLFAYLYQKYGKNAQRGNNLVIEQGNGGDENIPLRLIPLTLFGTLTTHLFGGSVGREGTAVQMGGAVADAIGRLFRLDSKERNIVIICGISAGFSSVFGTPLAGTLFGLEVLALGLIRSEAIFPSFFSAFFANIVTNSYGVKHTHYLMGAVPNWSIQLLFQLFICGIIFGVVGWVFSRAIVEVKKIYGTGISNPVIRNAVGGGIVLLLVLLFHSQKYLGLSLDLLKDAFSGQAQPFDFIGKLIFTVFSLGAGYQGGEVTPLFEIGATLGATLAGLFNLSVPFLAALGFIGVFAGATNTPVACFVMGIELFGADGALYLFMICVISYMCSGNSSIYSSQKIEIEKGILFQPVNSFSLKKKEKKKNQ